MLLQKFIRSCIYGLCGIFLVTGCKSSDDEVLKKISAPDGSIAAEMFLKTDSATLFWKIREVQGRSTLLLQEGTLGEPGRDFELSAQDRQQLMKEAIRVTREVLDKGFRTFGPEAYSQIIVQTDTTYWGPVTDLDKLALTEDLFNHALTTSGNGKCTGSDIGSKVSFYAMVFDAEIAARTLLKALRDNGTDLPVVIAIEKGNDIRVIWPENYHGDFSLL